MPAGVVDDFVADPWSAALAAGGLPGAFCLTVNVNCPPPSAVRPAYEAHVAAVRAAMGPALASGWYFAPFGTLHVTVASLVHFTCSRFADAESRRAIAAAWGAWLRCHMPHALPRAPLELVMAAPELSPAAAFFRYADSPSVSALRAAMARARSDPALAAAGAFEPGVGFRIPNIVHSSYARPCGAVDTAASLAAFAGAAASWAPLTVTVPGLLAVFEDSPYMHAWRPLYSGAFCWAPHPHPREFAPDALACGGLPITLTPLTPDDNAEDYAAVMRDIPMLRAWSGQDWPHAGFALADNGADVAAHAAEAAAGAALTYSVRVGGAIAGCVYARPYNDALRTRCVVPPPDAPVAGAAAAVLRGWAHGVPAASLVAAATALLATFACGFDRVWWQAVASEHEQLDACAAAGMVDERTFVATNGVRWLLRALPAAPDAEL